MWLVIWLPAYLLNYGPAVFINLCDIAVMLTCVGLWTGNALLISSQAVSSLLIDLTWNVDLVLRAITGRHFVGGTEYMWDAKYPVWLRLLSLFHIWLPVVLVVALRRLGYDRRAFKLQSAIGLAVLIASRLLTGPSENQNFAWRDPFFDRSWGPAPLHLALLGGVLVTAVYWPLHRLLARMFAAQS